MKSLGLLEQPFMQFDGCATKEVAYVSHATMPMGFWVYSQPVCTWGFDQPQIENIFEMLHCR